MIERIKRWLRSDLVSQSEIDYTKGKQCSENFARGIRDGMSGSNETCSWKVVGSDPTKNDPWSEIAPQSPKLSAMDAEEWDQMIADIKLSDIDKLAACLDDIGFGADRFDFDHSSVIWITGEDHTVGIYFDENGKLKDD